MRLTPPAIGLLRELSPEVPPEVRARLVLGEPPEALRDLQIKSGHIAA